MRVLSIQPVNNSMEGGVERSGEEPTKKRKARATPWKDNFLKNMVLLIIPMGTTQVLSQLNKKDIQEHKTSVCVQYHA